jgi:hypothetical protein
MQTIVPFPFPSLPPYANILLMFFNMHGSFHSMLPSFLALDIHVVKLSIPPSSSSIPYFLW